MPRKFLVTDTSTEIRVYEQTIVIPDDEIVYDKDGKYDAFALEHWPRRWPATWKGAKGKKHTPATSWRVTWKLKRSNPRSRRMSRDTSTVRRSM